MTKLSAQSLSTIRGFALPQNSEKYSEMTARFVCSSGVGIVQARNGGDVGLGVNCENVKCKRLLVLV